MTMVSVLMPVHNGAAYLDEALSSIRGQSWTDFELIVVDDASTDDSVAIAESCHDQRIRVCRAPARLGICGALNLGLASATGLYVARMDADDRAHPERLTRQVAFLDRNPRVVLCGTWARRFGAGLRDQVDRRPCGAEDIRAAALFDNPFIHSTVMIRRETLLAANLTYREEYRHAEDYDLWTRLMKIGPTANLPEVLLDYRVHAQNVTVRHGSGMDAAAIQVVKRLLEELNLDHGEQEVLFHRRLGTGQDLGEEPRRGLERSAGWLRRLLVRNQERRIYDPGALRRAVSDVWYRACYQALQQDLYTAKLYYGFWVGACRGAHPGWAVSLAAAAVKRALVGRSAEKTI